MRMEVARETGGGGQKKLIECFHLEMYSLRFNRLSEGGGCG